MASDDDEPRSWSADPEPSSASGGHIAPTASTLFEAAETGMTRREDRRNDEPSGWGSGASSDWDPLTAPLPSELDWLKDDVRGSDPEDPVARSSREWQDWGAAMGGGGKTDSRSGRSSAARPESNGGETVRERPERASAEDRKAAATERSAARAVGGTEAQTARLRPATAAATPARSNRPEVAARSEGAQVVRPGRFETQQSPARREEERREAAPGPRRVRRMAPRPVRRTLKHIHPLSVLKLSVFFYAIFLVIWLMVVAVLYWFVEGLGLFEAIEEFGKGMALDWGEINISLMTVEKWALMIGGIFALVASLINVFLAFLYNVGADLLGGVEMTFLERDGG